MAGPQGGIQNTIRQQCPYAMFIHCYSHKHTEFYIIDGAKTIKNVRFFVYYLTAFHTYLTDHSNGSCF